VKHLGELAEFSVASEKAPCRKIVTCTGYGWIVNLQVDREVIIDVSCGMAVLRGANIFTAGILAMSQGNDC